MDLRPVFTEDGVTYVYIKVRKINRRSVSRRTKPLSCSTTLCSIDDIFYLRGLSSFAATAIYWRHFKRHDMYHGTYFWFLRP
jgi:hypothetical protein